MLVIGLTGGIGSGKTAASDYFSSLGITVVDADLASRTVVQPGQPALDQIAKRFGDHMINADLSLNRAALRELVFSDKQALKALEAITHPAIRTELLNQLQQSQSPYTILVSPLLLETNQHQLTDRVLLIDAEEKVQIDRTVQRDKVPSQQVEAIMAAQMPRHTKQSKADDIALNNGDLAALHGKLNALHQTYLKLAQNS
ncbi:MAG: dephospho-CoA kinase [Gammaproteobacteria bacterium]|jgi:dephospho-CoA kinase|nr:dephospho-CoA kinase [Gammaproteobacteria bacterium]MBQ0775363.1 dephospho-CoA kinase [Gammaproteobacteria bacterium]